MRALLYSVAEGEMYISWVRLYKQGTAMLPSTGQ